MPVSDYTPTIDAVAAYIRARTKTRGGAEAGTFNSEAVPDNQITRPTSEQVAEVIANVTGMMSDTIGIDIPDVSMPAATRIAALGAAMEIELTYWPEQVNTGRSTYPQLKELWDERWEDLLTSMGISTDAGGGAVAADAGYPSYGDFPTTGIGMEFPW